LGQGWAQAGTAKRINRQNMDKVFKIIYLLGFQRYVVEVRHRLEEAD
jgi:hypothetical protein